MNGGILIINNDDGSIQRKEARKCRGEKDTNNNGSRKMRRNSKSKRKSSQYVALMKITSIFSTLLAIIMYMLIEWQQFVSNIKPKINKWHLFFIIATFLAKTFNYYRMNNVKKGYELLDKKKLYLNMKLAKDIKYRNDLDLQIRSINKDTKSIYKDKALLKEDIHSAKRSNEQEILIRKSLKQGVLDAKEDYERAVKEADIKYMRELTSLRSNNTIDSLLNQQLEINVRDYLKVINSNIDRFERQEELVGVYILKNLKSNKHYVTKSYNLMKDPKKDFEGVGNKEVFLDYRKNNEAWTIKMINLSGSKFLSLDNLEKYYADIYNSSKHDYNADNVRQEELDNFSLFTLGESKEVIE